MIPYLLLRKRCRLGSHWVLGHHPLLLLPLVTIVSYAAADHWLPGRAGYTAVLITSGVMLHFLHDGKSELGFPWLSPFSPKYFWFRHGKLAVVPPAEVYRWQKYRKSHDRSVSEEISGRAAPITVGQGLFWGAAMLALVAFYLDCRGA